MKKEQFEKLAKVESQPDRIHLCQENYTDNRAAESKTLLYGYDCDRNTWHVFQDHFGLIYLYVYKNNTGKPETEIRKVDVSGDGVASFDELIPNKRLYPQYCDYDFCEFLTRKGVVLPFTTWTDPQPNGLAFVGEIF